jgi:glutathione synthase
MRFAFVLDPLEVLKPYKDSSIAMMREAARRGHEVHSLEAPSLYVDAARVMARVKRLAIAEGESGWFRVEGESDEPLASYDCVMMRKDPPFDQEFYYATLLLERAQAEGVRVVNDPRALRDWNEKLAILRFPALAPATLVAAEMGRLQSFIDRHGDVIVKKLDGMGGTMVFRVTADDPNRNVIVETMTDSGRRTVMAQRFVPEIAQGDKRVLVVDGKPLAHCLARIPKAGETRGNLAAGATGVARPIGKRDREIAAAVGVELVRAGIVFAGLDVIGDWLTEVNVTSPTGIVEIAKQTGEDGARVLMDALGA